MLAVLRIKSGITPLPPRTCYPAGANLTGAGFPPARQRDLARPRPQFFLHSAVVLWRSLGEPEEDGRGRLLRRRVTLIYADYTDRSVQCRMTVLRRGEVPSSVASPTGRAHVSHSPVAHSPGRTFLHPSSSGSHCFCSGVVVTHGVYAASVRSLWLSTAQTKPTSSRAMATVTTLCGFR